MSKRMTTAEEYASELAENEVTWEQMLEMARNSSMEIENEASKRTRVDQLIAQAVAESMTEGIRASSVVTRVARMPSTTTRVDMGGAGLTMEAGGGDIFKVTPAPHKPVTWERGAYSIVRLNPNVDQYYVYNDQGLILTASDSFLEAEKFIQRQKTIDAQKAGLAPAKPEPPKTPENYGGW